PPQPPVAPPLRLSPCPASPLPLRTPPPGGGGPLHHFVPPPPSGGGWGGGPCINRDLGFAASNSCTSAVATSLAAPGRSLGSSHRQASRYASMSVDPSFMA